MLWIVLAHIVDIKYNGIPGKDRWGAFDYFYSFNNDFIQFLFLYIFNLGGIGVYIFYIASGFGLALLFNKKIDYFEFIKTRLIKNTAVILFYCFCFLHRFFDWSLSY